jgi:hypothetical protein
MLAIGALQKMKKTQSFQKRIGSILFFTFLALSCSKMNFGSVLSSKSVTPLANAVQCSVYLNSQLTNVTVTTVAENPTVTAECQPSQVTYAWTVTKTPPSLPVTINGLQGASSQGDFLSAGNGTYSIVLTASASGYSDYTSSPLTVVVKAVGGVSPGAAISCDVKLNNTLTAVEVASVAQNPKVSAICSPADNAYAWTVVKSGVTYSVPGLNGSISTPDFASQAPGKYDIYVRVLKEGYTPYELLKPLAVTVVAGNARAVTTTKAVTVTDNQLDVLLVVDDSNSMLADNQKLAAKLQGFVSGLSTAGFDWQMCVTTTRAQKYSANDPNLYWGSSVVWAGQGGNYPWVLKAGTANVSQVFTNTMTNIGAGWAGSDDERGIKAAWWHLWNGDPSYTPNSNCYRRDAGLAVVVISDEDERSIGGDKTQQFYASEYFPLETEDLPSTYVNLVKSIFGAQKRFTVNSLVVRPGDFACMKQQDAQGAKSHFGVKYAELSQLTGGYVGSICDADFTVSLKYFKDQIVSQMKSLPLECVPVGTVQANFVPAMNVNYSVVNMSLVFDPALPAGTQVTVNYQCAN